jgi:hypothetical protein
MKIEFKVGVFEGRKCIMAGGEVFDWGLEESAIADANQFSSNKDVMRAVHSDVQEFFLSCLEEQMGFRMGIKEVNEALRRGYVER